MRKIKNLFLLTFLVLYIFEQSLAQELNFQKLLVDIERGETDKARILLISLEKDNPSSPTVKFLKALLSEDGTEAAKLYRDVAFSFEETDLKDDALFKLYQYHYSRGEFNESDKYARMIKETFPQSEFVNYLRRENPSSSLLAIEQKFEQKNIRDTSRHNTQSRNIALTSQGKYSIQVGAFSTEANAQKFALQFSGYSTKIREKEISGKILYVVLVGDFESENDARQEMQTLKNKFKVDGILVSLK